MSPRIESMVLSRIRSSYSSVFPLSLKSFAKLMVSTPTEDTSWVAVGLPPPPSSFSEIVLMQIMTLLMYSMTRLGVLEFDNI